MPAKKSTNKQAQGKRAATRQRRSGLAAPVLEPLEARMLFSADPFGLAVDPHDWPEPLAASIDTEPAASGYELVLVNDNVGDLDTLLADLKAQSASGRPLLVHVLDSSASGMDQAKEILQAHDSLAAIHLLSHGNDHGLQLGGSWIDSASLENYADAFAQWQTHLQPQASLLVYGCDLAASERGVALLSELASLTGAAVAASDDATGHERLDADWDLEYRSADVRVDALLSDAAQGAWHAELATYTFRNDDAGGYTEAIDTQLSESTYSIDQGEQPLLGASQADTDSRQSLLRFDGIIGDVAGRIPVASSITSATLTLTISSAAEAGATGSLHTLLQGWDERASWAAFDAGVATDDVEAASVPVAVFAADANGQVHIDVTASVQAWLNGETNHGWVVTSDATGSALQFHSSDSADASLRPLLTIVQADSLAVTTTRDSIDATDLSSTAALQADPGPDGVISLREAVIATNNTPGADTIHLPAGHYDFSIAGSDDQSAVGDLDVLDQLTIRGAGGEATVIDANAIHRHFALLDHAGGASLSLHDLTLINGEQDSGGSLLIESNSSLELNQVVLDGNTTDGGTDGGAIYNEGALVVNDSTLVRNTAPNTDGGAIYSEGSLSISDSRFIDNEARNGGAVQYSGTGVLSIENTDFNSNSATSRGGALDAKSGLILIGRSALHSNTAEGGGAINVDGSASTRITHSTISGNGASGDGGGIRARGGGNSMEIDSSTIAFNDAGDGGGYDNNGDVASVISNSIFEGNTRNSSTPNSFGDNDDISSAGYNIVSDDSSNFSQTGDLTEISANLQALQYTAGSNVPSHPLSADSPARDSGEPTLSDDDINGNPRTGVADRGAAESYVLSVAHTRGAPIVDGVVDPQWSESEVANLAEYSGGAVVVTGGATASWRAAWDDTSLYLLVEVNDDTPVEDSTRAWRDDSIAVYLDPDVSRGSAYDNSDDTHFSLARSSNELTLIKDPLLLNDVTVATTDTDSGYLKEIAIPWSALGVAPTAGLQMGIELHVTDDIDGGLIEHKLAWADDADVASAEPSSFGAIVLDAALESAGPDGLNHGISINTDGGNNSYFEAPSSLMLGLGNHTVQTRFSTTADTGLSVIPWIDGVPISYFLTADMADGQVHTHTQIWNSDTGYRAAWLDNTMLWEETNLADAGKTVTATQPLVIGQNLLSNGAFNPSRAFSGTIHDVRIWDYAFSADDISGNQHRQFSAASAPSELIANWRFERLTGSDNDRVVDMINPGSNDLLLKSIAVDATNWTASVPTDVLSLDDNAPAGHIIGHLSPTDADVNTEQYFYSLTDDADGRFAIDAGSGQLQVADAASIEGGGSEAVYSVTVRVTDETGQRFERNLSIATQPVNEAPTLSGLPAHDTVFYGGAVTLGSGLLPDDPELSALGSYDGFEIRLQRDGGANAEDVFSLVGSQSGTSIIHAHGDVLLTVGTVVQNSAGLLQLQFNAAATASAVRDVVRTINYSNSGDISAARSLQLRWTLDDNNTGSVQGSGAALTGSQLQTVHVRPPNYQAVNDDLGAILSGSVLPIAPLDLTGNDTGYGTDMPFLVSVTTPPIGTLNEHSGGLELSSATDATGTGTFNYLAAIGNDNIINQWPLTQGGIDETGRSSGTVVTNGPVHELQFDGDDYVEIPNFDYPSEFTLTFDFKVNSLNNNDEEVLIAQGDFETANSLLVWITGENYQPNRHAGQLVTNIWDSTDTDDGYNGYRYDVSGFENDGLWHNYAIVVHEGVGTSIFIDGVQIDTSSHTRGDAPFTPGESLFVGVEDHSSNGLDFYLKRHQIANLRLIDGFELADIQANEVNQFSAATASFTIRNEEMLVNNDSISVSEDQTVLISTADLLSEDVEDGPSLLNYEIIAAPANGTLLLDAVPLAAGDTFTQQQIDDSDLRYRHDGSESATEDVISLRVDDGAGSHTDFDFSIDLTPLNDAPLIALLELGALVFTEGDGAVDIATGLALSDADDSDFVSAQVRISAGYQAAEDRLIFTDTANISGSFDQTTGVLTLIRSGTTDTASWQAALRSIQYRNDAENPTAGVRTLQWTIDDGDDTSAAVSRLVQVISVNDSPTQGDAHLAALPEDAPDPPGASVTALLGPHFSDVDGTLAGVAISANDAVSEGSWQYSADAGGQWHNIASVSPTTALAIDAAALLRFVPASDFFGDVPQLTLFAIDDSYSGAFTSATDSSYINVASVGSGSPFAMDAATISSFVAPIGPTDLSRGIELNTDGGNDSYLLADDGGALLGGLTEVSMEALFAIDTINSRNALISYSAIAGDDTLKLLVRDNGVVDVGVLGNDVLSVPVPALVDGRVHSVAATWQSSGGHLNLYADGVLIHTQSGIASGATLQAGGTLVLGMEQDLPGGGFETSEVFSGTLHEVRLWSEVRTEAEIAADHHHKLYVDDLPDTLLANWQMDGFDNSGVVIDTVSGNNLSVAHTSAIGFSASTPVGVFSVAENAAAGTILGTVLGSAAVRGDDLIQDGLFTFSAAPAIYTAGDSIGGSGGHWQVDRGSVELSPAWQASPLAGQPIDLAATSPAQISQTIATQAGQSYQLYFALSGDFRSADEHRLRVTIGADESDFTVHQPNNWSQSNLLWEPRSLSFTATSDSTTISFAALAATGTAAAIIGDVQVLPVDPAIATLLAANPALSYDAGTHKFYQANVLEAEGLWVTAQNNAVANQLNGVNGRLVTIQSEYENRLVRDLAAAMNRNIFLGATDQTTEGQWYWHSGTGDSQLLWSGAAGGNSPDAVYTNWRSGEPNNHRDIEDHAVMFHAEGNGVWNDAKPIERYGSVVEWDAGAVLANFHYSIVSDPAAAFSLDAVSGELSVADITGIDYETDPSYEITVRVSDATGEHHDETLTIVIVDASAPQLTAVESAALSYVENQGPVAVTADLLVNDSDDTLLQSATVSIRDYLAGDDSLIFNDFGSFSSNWDVLTGSLTINGSATLADWQIALRSVQYSNASDDPGTRTTTIDFVVSDGTENSNIASRAIEIIPVNQAPSLNSDATLAAIDEDQIAPPGATVGTLFTSYFSDVDSAFGGVAVIADASTGEGVWQVSIDNGANWVALGSVSKPAAVALEASALLRFLPAADYYGSVPALNVVAIDDSYAGTYYGDPAFVPIDVSIRGDSTPFSIDSKSLQSSVAPLGPTGIATGIALNTEGGNDAYLIAADGDALLAGLSSLTIETQLAIGTPARMNPLLSYATADASNALLLAVEDDGTLFIHINDERIDVPSPYATLLDGERHAVAFSWDAQHGIFAFYVNGELVHSGRDLQVGYAFGNGELVVGHDQDSVDGGYDPGQLLQGRYHDLRIWNEVRSEAEIAQTYQHQLHPGSLPSSLIANWQMDGFDSAGRVVDVVNGNNLSVAHASGSGFVAGTAQAALSVSQSADNGTSIGRLVPRASTVVADLVRDGTFTYAGDTAVTHYAAGNHIGGAGGAWRVDSGNVGVETDWPGTPLGGEPIDLDGTTPGAISQTIDTLAGQRYQLLFSLSGNFSDGVAKTLTVNVGDRSETITVTPPSGWSFDNSLWQRRSIEFIASGAATTLSFASESVAGAFGPAIADVQVVAVPTAAQTLLDNNAGLSYDAGSGKFYRAVSTAETWLDARDLATAERLNGVAGQLATVSSAYENAQLVKLGQTVGGNVWLGATDADSEGDWFWQDSDGPDTQFWNGPGAADGGMATNNQYTNWRVGEPNDVNDEDYAMLSIGDGRWNDQSSDKLRRYIIEWDADTVLSTVQYALISDPVAAFGVDSDSGEITVANASALAGSDSLSHDIVVRVTDASGEFHNETLTIEVIDNAAPTLAAIESTPLIYTENDAPLAISGTLLVGDADSSTLQTATISISAGYVEGEDQLTFVGDAGFTGNWEPITGTLSITGYAAPDSWQTVLRSVSYENISDDPSATDRTIEFLVYDAIEPSNSQSRTVVVHAVNDAPSVSVALPVNISEDEISVAGDTIRSLFSNALSDVDGDVIGIAIIADATTSEGEWQYSTDAAGSWYPLDVVSRVGALALGVDSHLRFVPAVNYHGAIPALSVHMMDDSVSLAVTDGASKTYVDVSLSGVSTPFSDVSVAIDGNVASVFDAPANTGTLATALAVVEDIDSELDLASIEINQGDHNGALTLRLETLNGGLLTAKNDPAVSVLSAADSIELTATAAALNAYLDDRSAIHYVHGVEHVNGAAADILQISLGYGVNSVAVGNVAIDIGSINDAPQSGDSRLSLLEDTTNTLSIADFVFNDPQEADELLAVHIESVPVNAALLLNGSAVSNGQIISASAIAAGSLQIVPATDDNGDNYDTLRYRVQDNGGSLNGGADVSDTVATIVLDVEPVNDTPILVVNPVAIQRGESVVLTSHINAFDPDVGLADRVVVVTAVPAYGQLQLNGTTLVANGTFSQADVDAGLLRYVHGGDPAIDDAIALRFTDYGADASTLATARILTIHVVETHPLAQPDSVSLSEGQAIDIAVLDNDNGTDEPLDPGSVDLFQAPLHGRVEIDATGVLSYWHNGGESRTDSLQYTVADSGGQVSDPVSVNIAIDAVNDAPQLRLPPVTTDLFGNDENYWQSATLADGSIVAIGAALGETDNAVRILLSRFTNDGVADPGFGNNGHLLLDALPLDPALEQIGYAVAGTANGQILIAVQANGQALLGRLDADGTLDPAFGVGGWSTINLNGASQLRIYDVLELFDQRLLVSGYAEMPDRTAVAIRLSADGTVETGLLPVTAGGAAHQIQLDGSDRYLVAVANGDEQQLIRLFDDGQPDISFDTDGVLDTGLATGGEAARPVLVQGDGKILVAGIDRNATPDSVILQRHLDDGSVDTGFAAAGRVPVPFADTVYAVGAQSDGKIIVVGSQSQDREQLVLARFSSDGALDTSFGQQGSLQIPLSTTSWGVGLDIDSEDRIVLSGADTANSANWDAVLLRLLPDGQADLQFANRQQPLAIEQQSAVTVSEGLLLVDAELSANDSFDGATLQLQRGGAANSADQFSSSHLMLAPLLEGAELIFDATVVGSVLQNSGGTLLLQFNAAASSDIVNDVAGSIEYTYSSDTPPASIVLQWQLSDNNSGAQGSGGAGTADAQVVIELVAVNDAPVVSTGSAAVSHTEAGAAVAIAPALSISDAEYELLDAAALTSVTLQRLGGASGADQFVATGLLGALQTGSAFTDAGVRLGTINGNAAGSLQITFDAGVDTASISNALRQIGYQYLGDTPPPQLTLQWTFNDGNTGAQGQGGDASASGNSMVSIVATDDVPLIDALASTPFAYIHGAPAVALAPAIAIADPDSTLLSGARVSVDNYQSGVDVLSIDPGSGLSSSWDPASGTLELTGVASLASYQNALRTLNYFSVDLPLAAETDRLIRITVTDDSGAVSDAGIVELRLTVPEHFVTLASGDSAARVYIEGAPALALVPDLVVTSLDVKNIVAAELQISQGYNAAEDSLELIHNSGLISNWDPGSGTLLISGSAEASVYQSLLRAVGYTNSSEDPDTANRTVSIQLESQSGESNLLDIVVLPVPVNDSPSAEGTQLTVSANSSRVLTTDVFGFSDPLDRDNLQSVIIETLPLIGQLIHRDTPVEPGTEIDAAEIAGGYLRYTVAQGNATPALQDQFDYRVRDDGGLDQGGVDVSVDSATIIVDIDFADSTNPGQPGEPGFRVNENIASATFVGALDSLPVDARFTHLADGDFASPVALNADLNRFAADGSGDGAEISSWQVVDGEVDLRGGYWQRGPDGGNALELNGDTAGAITQQIATQPGAQYRLNFVLAGNFRYADDADQHALQVVAGSTSTVMLVDNSSQWSETRLQWQQQSLTFTATDTQTTIALRSLTPGAQGAIVADIEVIDVLTYELVSTDVPFELTPEGRLSSAAEEIDHEARDAYQLDVRVSDTSGRDMIMQVPIAIVDLNEAPQLIANQTLQVIAGSRVIIAADQLAASDVDDADQLPGALNYTLTEVPAAGVLLLDQAVLAVGERFSQQDLLDARVSYQHDGSPAAFEQFGFQLHDGGEDGALHTDAIFNIEVREPLDLLITNNWSMLEGGTLTLSSAQIDRQGGFIDDADLLVQLVAQTGAAVELLDARSAAPISTFSLQDLADGNIVLRHNGSEQHSVGLSFEFQRRDNGLISVVETAAVDLSVVDVADPPMASNSRLTTDHINALTITEQQISFSDGDDADSLAAIVIQALPVQGTLQLAGAPVSVGDVIDVQSLRDAELEYLPFALTSGTRLETIGFTVIDSGDTASGGVNESSAINTIEIVINSDHKPVAGTDVINVQEGATVNLLASGSNSVIANDSDFDTPRDELLVQLLRAPEYGTLTLNADGTFEYRHDGGESRQDTFSYLLADDAADLINAEGAIGEVDIAIAPRNDPPQAGDTDDRQIVANELLQIELPDDLFVDRDIEDSLTLAATRADGSPLPEWLQFDAETGTFSGVPDANSFGTVPVKVTATDQAGATAETRFEITVEPLLDAALPATAEALPPEPARPAQTAVETPVDGNRTDVSVTAAGAASSVESAQGAQQSEEPAQDLTANALDLLEQIANRNASQQEFLDNQVVKHRGERLPDLQLGLTDPLREAALELRQLSLAMQVEAYEVSDAATQKLDRMRDSLIEVIRREDTAVASGVTISAGLSVGYIVWLLRGGLLLGSLMSAMPAWRWIDPLPVLRDSDSIAEEDTESLQTMVNESTAPTPQHAPTDAPPDSDAQARPLKGAGR